MLDMTEGLTCLMKKGEPSSKRMKDKTKFSKADEVIMIKAGLDNVADAIEICATEMRHTKKRPYKNGISDETQQISDEKFKSATEMVTELLSS